MCLRAANWPSTSPSPPINSARPPCNKMSLSNIVHGREREDYGLFRISRFDQNARSPTPGTSRCVDDSSDESSYSNHSTPSSVSQWSREDTDSLSEGYTNRSAPYLPRRPDVIPARTYQTVRSATIYSRKCRHDRTKPKFGEIKNDRHYCTYVDTRTKLTCAIWPDGYTTWYDLVRHADAEHGPEEVALIEQGLLDYTKAQWIKTEDQFHAIKAVSREMHCTECGMQFASNRQDSKERHRKRGACQRRQAKKQKSDFDSMVHYPKRKGGKTSPTNKRR